ncbi:MAG: hypothetical protein ABL919_08880 [Methylococcales bacterium]|nr:hypothetical protein [Methylococcaceae bacterium]
MNKVNVALVRLLQFVVFVFFVFAVTAYFGALVLLPLDLIVLLSKLLSVIGFNAFIGALVAAPAVGYLAFTAYKIPGLGSILVETGVDLVKTGKARVDAFNSIASAVKA